MSDKAGLKEQLQEDANKVRGACREILEHNRQINTKLVEDMTNGDMTQIEEYNMLVKGLLDASKLLTDLNAQTPKTIKEIEKIEESKKKIDLDSLMDSED